MCSLNFLFCSGSIHSGDNLRHDLEGNEAVGPDVMNEVQMTSSDYLAV